MSRYEAVGSWRELRREQIGNHVIVTEIADCRDKRDGHVYGGGTYRVSVEGPQPKPRTKRWYGEMAWASAARYEDDAFWQFRREARGIY